MQPFSTPHSRSRVGGARAPRLFKNIGALFAALLVLFVTSNALAGGRVIWKKTTINEHSEKKSWLLKLEIHLNTAPSVGYVPMKLELTKIADYERMLVDGHDGPIMERKPLTGEQAVVESLTVGFKDSSTQKIMKATRFRMRIGRSNGFDAGEYKVVLKDSRTGQRIGGTTILKLKGDNPVVDRRSMDFAPPPRKKKKEEPAEEEQQEAPEPEPEPEPAPAPVEQADPPGEVKERPGGGCHHEGGPISPSAAWILAALGLFGFVALRRRA